MADGLFESGRGWRANYEDPIDLEILVFTIDPLEETRNLPEENSMTWSTPWNRCLGFPSPEASVWASVWVLCETGETGFVLHDPQTEKPLGASIGVWE